MRIGRSFCQAVTVAKLFIYISVANVIIVLIPTNWQFNFRPPINMQTDRQTEPHHKGFFFTFRITNPKNDSMKQHINIIYNYYKQRKEWETSNLGTYLFKQDINSKGDIQCRNQQRIFNVLMWNYWPWLELRHVYRFQTIHNDNINPLYGCSVSNCRFSGDYNFTAADTVVVHLQSGLIPNITSRDPSQLWIFWVDESPVNAFTLASKWPKLAEFSNIFNWSMTYRTDSDIPVPYGRTLSLKYPILHNITHNKLKELVPYWKIKRTDVLATILISNCYATRFKFVKKIKEHIKIDIFGSCALDESSKNRCPGHFRSDCNVISKYLFYIVAENSKCQQYITEKCFHHAYSKGAIPVIMGPSLEDCNELLPPDSFLHVDNFKTPGHLALEILSISENMTKLLSYHVWRNHFEVTNEHGYFGTKSSHLCRICEALNYNERKPKVYDLDALRWYLDSERSCSRFT